MKDETIDELTYDELHDYANCTGEVDFETMEYDLKRMAIEILELRKERAWRPLPPVRQEMGG